MQALEAMLILLSVMALGYILGRRQIFSSQIITDLSLLVTQLTAPLLILSSINFAGDIASKKESLIFLLLCFLVFTAFALLSFPISRWIPFPEKSKSVVQFLMTCQNNGFIGYPIIMSIFGEGGLFYAMLLNIPSAIFLYSFGQWVLARDSEENMALSDSLKNVLLTPGSIASFTALLFFLLDWQLPSFLLEITSLVGGTTTPLTMIIIGLSISTISIKDALTNKWVYLLILIKMIILPSLLYFIMSPLISEPVLLSIMIILFSMPGASVTTSLARLYGGDEEFASSYVFVSTLLTVIIVPGMITVFNLV